VSSDLTIDPERESRRICEYLGVDREATMLDYRAGEHGRFRAGLGDRTGRITSGEIQPVRELPPDSAVPSVPREIGAAWGSLGASPPA
jgi:hypothetical protein